MRLFVFPVFPETILLILCIYFRHHVHILTMLPNVLVASWQADPPVPPKCAAPVCMGRGQIPRHIKLKNTCCDWQTAVLRGLNKTWWRCCFVRNPEVKKKKKDSRHSSGNSCSNRLLQDEICSTQVPLFVDRCSALHTPFYVATQILFFILFIYFLCPTAMQRS